MATWGNLANRMLSFAYEHFDGVMPEPGNPSRSSAKGLDNENCAFLEKVEAGFETVGVLYSASTFRAAQNAALALAREADRDTFARSMLAREPAVASQLPS